MLTQKHRSKKDKNRENIDDRLQREKKVKKSRKQMNVGIETEDRAKKKQESKKDKSRDRILKATKREKKSEKQKRSAQEPDRKEETQEEEKMKPRHLEWTNTEGQ